MRSAFVLRVVLMTRRCLLVAASLLLLPSVSCRKVEKNVEQQDFSLLRASRPAEWYPGAAAGQGAVDLGPQQKPQALLTQAYEGPATACNLTIEPEDTLDLFARWTGRPVAELLKLNPEVVVHGLVPGEGFQIRLTADQFARFNGARNGYLAAARARHDPGILTIVKHEVRDGETLRDILSKYATTLDLLEHHNPEMRLTGIRAKQTLSVPIVAEDLRDQPAMPGPRPPLSPPTPVPPQDPKPVTAAPGGAPKAPAKPTVAAAGGTQSYTVQPGDTAWVVAWKKLHISPDALAQANPGVDLTRLTPGKRLNVPK